MPETGNEEEQKEEKVKKNAPEDIYRVTNKHSALKLSRFKKNACSSALKVMVHFCNDLTVRKGNIAKTKATNVHK